MPLHPETRTTPTRPHPLPLRVLHWLTAGGLVLAFALALGRDAVDAEGTRRLMLGAHRWIGLLIWAATWGRVSVKLHALITDWHRGRDLASATDTTPLATRLAAFGAHGLMYLGLLALPLLGWALSSAHGVDLSIGPVHLPALVDADPDLADTLDDTHSYLGYALGGLIGLHLLAVVWHQRWRRDDVLSRMLPGHAR
ncbi:cytochrome b [Sphaerotilus sp.]|uniref:cytochrome b n=1 Tax=Sphaerotilus sp. TaxID=2093942 RepID=UPI0034E2938C